MRPATRVRASFVRPRSKQLGFRVITTRDGLAAWREIARTKPKCVVLDSEISGYPLDEVISRLDADPACTDVRVATAPAGSDLRSLASPLGGRGCSWFLRLR